MTGCGSLLARAGFSPCPAAPVATVVRVCVHEHLRKGLTCQGHLDMPSSCDVCRTCVEPHLCILRELERTT